MKKLNKKGFTLVELLAVIVILALLMVVATRTIGGSLTNSRKSAMQTEAQKLLSKSYEDIQSAELNGNTISATTFTYAKSGETFTVPATGTAKIELTDGNYHAVLTINNSKVITNICIDDGNKNTYSKSVINGNTVQFSSNEDYSTTGTSNCTKS